MSTISHAEEYPVRRTCNQDGIVTLTLSRGDRFNPLSSAMIAALQAELDSIATDDTARVIILAAEGKGFCSGHDLKEIREHAGDQAWQRQLFDDCSHMMLTLNRMPQPVIARVQGIATAAGCQLVASCDLAVASENAEFALPGVNIGLFCSTPAVPVVRAIGRKRTMEMLLTGKAIDAATALSWGLVNRVVPADRLDEEIREFTDVILAKSPAAIGMGKQAYYSQIDRPMDSAYDLASDAMARNLTHEDAAEGINAFLEKRSPNWRGK